MNTNLFRCTRHVLSCLLTTSLILLPLFMHPGTVSAAGVLYSAPAPNGSGDCTSWADACSLQTALTAALSGDQIWVKSGVHKPGAARADTFTLQPGVAVYGGFAGTETQLNQRDWLANITVLSGDIDGNDLADPSGVVTSTANIAGSNSYHVVTAGSTVAETARLDGFTITAGQANGASPDANGGGVYNLAGDPTIANTRLSGNLAASRGGGMYNEGIYGNGSSPNLSEVTFSGNSADGGGGMANYYFASPALTQVTFSGNTASSDGGGMHNQQDANPSLTDCSFLANTATTGGGIFNYIWANPNLIRVLFQGNSVANNGGGMASYNSAHPSLDEVTFQNNTAANGGGMFSYYNADSPSIKNTRFIGNSAANGGGLYSQEVPYAPQGIVNALFLGNTASSYGGAIYSDRSRIALTNATLSENSASVRAGAFYNFNQGDATMSNVILWDNSAPADPEIHNDTSTNTISYSLVAGSGGSGAGWNSSLGSDGGGNLDSNPYFQDAAGGDLRLQDLSPAIDAGNNSAVPAGVTTDLNGGPRFADISGVADTGSGTAPIVDMGAYETGFVDLALEKDVSAVSFLPGDAITFTLSVSNTGVLTATQLTLTDTLSAGVVVNTVSAQGIAITATAQTPAYVWMVQDLAPGQGGEVTLQGTVKIPLSAGVYTNTAQITSLGDALELNNRDTVTYTVANAAPAFTSTPVTSGVQGSLYSYAITTQDNNGDALAITADTMPAWLALTENGDGTAALGGTPINANVGDHSVELRVTGGGLFATQVFTLTVANLNEAPFFTSLPLLAAS